MTMTEYLDLLRYYLRKLPSGMLHDILMDYEAHFKEGMANGRSEFEISKELGPPFEIAEEYLSNEYSFKDFRRERTIEHNYDENINRIHGIKNLNLRGLFKFILIFIGIVICIPPLIGIIIGFFGLIFALLTAFISLIVGVGFGGIALGFSTIPGFYLPSNIYLGGLEYFHPLTRFFFAVALVGISILLFNLFIQLAKWVLSSMKKFISIAVWEYKKRRRKS